MARRDERVDNKALAKVTAHHPWRVRMNRTLNEVVNLLTVKRNQCVVEIVVKSDVGIEFVELDVATRDVFMIRSRRPQSAEPDFGHTLLLSNCLFMFVGNHPCTRRQRSLVNHLTEKFFGPVSLWLCEEVGRRVVL